MKIDEDNNMTDMIGRNLVDINAVDVESAVSKMLDILDRDDKKTRNKCYRIVESWLNDVPTWFAQQQLRGYDFDRNLGYVIYIRELRKVFPFKYYKDGKAYYWYKEFQNGLLPLFRITKRGYNSNGKAEASHGWPLFSMRNVEMNLPKTTQPEQYDIVLPAAINYSSLEAYMFDTRQRLQTSTNQAYSNKLRRNETAAVGLLSFIETNSTVVSDHIRMIDQYYTKHAWGRYYGTKGSYSIQTLPREPRNAALAGTVCIDLDTAVFAFYKTLCLDFGIPVPVSLDEMLENKSRWRKRVAIDAIVETRLDLDVKVSLVKEAITALGFGADFGNFGSIKDIIWHTKDRERLEQHPWVQQLLSVKKDIIKVLKSSPVFAADAKQHDDLLYKNGAVNWNATLASMYQTHEAQIIKTMRNYLTTHGVDVYLILHDGLYVDSKYKTDGLQWDLEDQIRAEFGSHYSISAEKIKPYHNASSSSSKAHSEYQNTHNDRLKAEQELAEMYAAVKA